MTRTMDRLSIIDFRVAASIGIFPEEKTTLQPLIITCHFFLPLQKVATQQKISLDYAEAAENIRQFISHTHIDLIETLAYTLIAHLFTKYREVHRIELTIQKPSAIKEAAHAQITIHKKSPYHRPTPKSGHKPLGTTTVNT